MSLSIDGIWKAGVCATTVWAEGVWFEGPYVPPVTPPNTTPPGGGRIIGYLPDFPKKKRKVEVKWTDDNDKELIRRLKQIDDDYEKKRRQQLNELLEILRSAIHLGNQVSFSGFNYLTPDDIKKAKRKVQIEEENTIILALIK
jgi:nucleoid DNA-binding protein